MKIGFLFDMDGVIVDSNPVHKVALKDFCRKYGHDLTEDELREKIYGRTNKDWIPAVFGNIPASQVKKYGDEKEALFREMYLDSIRPLDGLIDFLELLVAGGYDRAIATSAPRENVDFILKHTNTAKYFQTILDESFVSKGKPDPEIYTKTAAALGYSPSHCIVFEDSIAGVKSGKAAGCKVVGILTTHTKEELADTDEVSVNFTELRPEILISKLFRQ